MDPLMKMRKKYSQGRRSSVDPMRIQMDESCLTSTADKRYRSGIPKLLVSSSTVKRRSSSCDRTQACWSVAKTHERCSNAAGLLFTPQNAVTPKISYSARAAMDCISQLSCKSQTGRKDHRAISDKNVQIRLARYVCSYLNRTGLVGDLLAGGQGKAPSGAIQPTDLRNMNKNAFLILFNFLYKELGARNRIDINSTVYQEKIPALAKKMGYSGIINKSHLLTPSSPHSWPYIIAFLAWMVDLLEALETYEDIINDATNMEMVFMHFHLKSYLAYNNQEISGSPPEEYIEEFKKELDTIRNVEPEVMNELMETRNRLKAQFDAEQENEKSVQEEFNNKNKSVASLAEGIEEITKYIGDFDNQQAMIKQEITESEVQKKSLVVKLEELRKEKDNLNRTCSQQKMCKAEWDKLVSEIKEIKATIKMKVELCENIKTTIDNTDLQISSKRNKLNKVWVDVVNATMPMEADTVLVKNFLDLVQNFNHLQPDASQCFKQLQEILQQAHTEITAKVMHDQARAKTLQDQFHEFNLKSKNVHKRNEHFTKLCEDRKNAIKSIRDSFVKEEDEFNEKINQVKLEIKQIDEIVRKDGSGELLELKEIEGKKRKELEDFKRKSEVYFKDITEMAASYHKIATEKIQFFLAEVESIYKEQNDLDLDFDTDNV